MKTFKELMTEAKMKTINIDDIKDKSLNKKAWSILKKKQKAYYSETDNEVVSHEEVKKSVGSIDDLFKFTDYKSVVAPGKKI
jgi:hypothetical protein